MGVLFPIFWVWPLSNPKYGEKHPPLDTVTLSSLWSNGWGFPPPVDRLDGASFLDLPGIVSLWKLCWVGYWVSVSWRCFSKAWFRSETHRGIRIQQWFDFFTQNAVSFRWWWHQWPFQFTICSLWWCWLLAIGVAMSALVNVWQPFGRIWWEAR